MPDAEPLLDAVLDSLPALVVLLDANGIITHAGDGWSRAARERGLAPERVGTGTDYLAACRRASEQDPTARPAAEGLREVLQGRRARFELEYACAEPGGEVRWYLLQACALPRERGGAVVSHLDITLRRRVEEAADAQARKYRAMFEGTGAAVWDCDYSGARPLVEALRARGVADVGAYLRDHPEVLREAMTRVRVREVNARAVELVEASDPRELLHPPLDAVTPEAQEEFAETLAALAEGREHLRTEATLRTRRGALRRAVVVTAFPDGWEGVLRTAVDVTERWRAEEALRESEARFRTVADAAPVLIWMRDEHEALTWVNRPWAAFIGTEADGELEAAWRDALHPEDAGGVTAVLRLAQQAGEPFQLEYRLRRADGEYRWILEHGVPRAAREGIAAGYIGSCVDITARRSAEAALRQRSEEVRGLAGRLIEAQEEERRRIGRELHDDIAQRFARLSMDVSALHARMHDAAGDTRTQLERLNRQVADVAAGLRGISHRMHPAVLEHAGLLPALRAFAAELEAHGLHVRLDLPPSLPPLSREAALCVYRVAQEALWNVVRHAGTPQALVRLEAEADALRLTVHDAGAGFDAAAPRGGLGLVSMAERARLVDGSLEVRSAPGAGTEIRLSIPGLSVAQ